MSTTWYAKIDCNFHSNRKAIKAGRLGREVFVFVLCLNAQRGGKGQIPAGDLEPWYVAEILQMSEHEASEGIRNCISAGLFEIWDGIVHLVGWTDEWAKRPMTPAERMSKHRAKKDRQAPSAIETYVVAQEGSGCIKVGKSVNVPERIAELQTGSPANLEIVHIIKGDHEKQIHALLAEFAVRGEWFKDGERQRDLLSDYLDVVETKRDEAIVTVTQTVTGNAGRKEGRKEGREGDSAPFDPTDPAQTGMLARKTWSRLSEIRIAIANELGIAGVLPLTAITPASSNQPGFRNLTARIHDEGINAPTVCARVLEVLTAQARDTRSIDWLSEKAFSEGAWRHARESVPKWAAAPVRQTEHGTQRWLVDGEEISA